jgi:hypothetical protein
MRRPILIALAGLFLLVSPASAKEISKVTACGARDCTSVTADKGDQRLMAFAESVGPTDPPSGAARWYRVTLTVDEGNGHTNSWSNAWVPSATLLRVRDDAGTGFTWLAVGPDTERALNGLTRGLRPYPAARLRGLDGKLPEPQVSEVVTPAPPAHVSPPASDSTPWPWLAAGGAALLLAVVLAGRAARPAVERRMRPRGAP